MTTKLVLSSKTQALLKAHRAWQNSFSNDYCAIHPKRKAMGGLNGKRACNKCFDLVHI